MRFLVPIVAALRLLWLGKSIQGDFSIVRVISDNESLFVFLPANADTESTAKLSLFWNSRAGHAIVQRSSEGDEVGLRRFRVLRNMGEPITPISGAWLSGWLGEKGDDFGFHSGLIGCMYHNHFCQLPNGTQAFRLDGDASKWVIHIHGRKASYAETLRNAQQFESLGFTQLAISHESDDKPFGLGKRRTALGEREWRQVSSAVDYARNNGAQNIILFGWSLGGLFINQFLKMSSDLSKVRAVIFDSPLLDYRSTLQLQAGRSGYARDLADRVIRVLKCSPMIPLLGFSNVDVARLSSLDEPLPNSIPALLFFSSNDGFVSMNGVYRYRELNPKTKLVEIFGARHCRLFNENLNKYQKEIGKFIDALQI